MCDQENEITKTKDLCKKKKKKKKKTKQIQSGIHDKTQTSIKSKINQKDKRSQTKRRGQANIVQDYEDEGILSVTLMRIRQTKN